MVKEQLHEYEVTLTRIIPRDIEHGNDTVREEIFHLLFDREWLEVQLQKHGVENESLPLWQRLQELDRILIAQREAIVNAYTLEYYHYQRERLKMPRECWWWYLDELESVELPVYNDGRPIEDIKGVENLQVQAGNQN